MYRPCGLCQSFHISGIVVGHEYLVGVQAVAEDLCPGTAMATESLCHPGVQAFLVGFQIVYQFLGHFPGEKLVGSGRVVAGVLEHANLVLHLYHHYRMVLAVNISDMAHQLAKSAVVGLKNIGREHAGYLKGLARGGHCAGKTLGVGLEPFGGVAAHGVLPCAKPQEDDFQLVLSRPLYRAVDEGEVELSLHGFGEVPLGRHEHGVQSEGGHAGHHLVDVGYAGGGRVAELASKHNHGDAVDGELGVRTTMAEPGLGRGGGDNEPQQHRPEAA